jgi:hypothetical protein
MEPVIWDNSTMHFLMNDLFSENVFGLINGRSTVMQPLNVLDRWMENLEIGCQMDVIYRDFEKAFDKVPHRR